MNQPQTSSSAQSNPTANQGSLLIEHIRSFLHLTTQAPLEYVCKSALYLLTHVPATRSAVYEYIGTFYKVATFLYIRYNQSLKNTQKNAEQQTAALLSNIQHINQVIDFIEGQLGEILSTTDNEVNDLWSLELAKWLIELMGDIVLNKGATFGDSGLSEEEANSFKSFTLIDALEFWSNKCKPTMGILKLVHKCFVIGSEDCQEKMIDLIFVSSKKFGESFDWILTDLAALSPQFMFEKCLKNGFQEFLLEPKTRLKLVQVNFINFYALNYSRIVKIELTKFASEINNQYQLEQKKLALAYLLKLISSTPTLLNVILNELLNNSATTDETSNLSSIFKSCLQDASDSATAHDKLIITNLIECIKNVNNSIAVMDVISSLVNFWFLKPSFSSENETKWQSKIIDIIKVFLEDLEVGLYNNNGPVTEDHGQEESTVPFLECLNQINGVSFMHLLDQIFAVLKLNAEISDFKFTDKTEILNKFLILLAINGNDYISNLIMSQFLRMPLRLPAISETSTTVDLNYSDWPMLLRFRQEINSFHHSCLSDTVRSLCKSFAASNCENTELENFLQNVFLIHDWDLKNKNYMSENVSFILMEHDCVVNLLGQLGSEVRLKSNISYLILDLYIKVLKSPEEKSSNSPVLKLSVADMLVLSDKCVSHFFKLVNQMNEENLARSCEEINKLIEFIKYALMHISYQNEESPFRTILLRNLIKKLFVNSSDAKTKKLENISDNNYDQYSTINDDELSSQALNLFESNLVLTSNDMASHKTKFKNFKNTLSEFPDSRKSLQKKSNNKSNSHKYKAIMSLAFMDLLEIICSRSLESTEEFSKFKTKRQMFDLKKTENEPNKTYLLTDQMCIVAESLVEYVMLEQHYIDSQWPSPLTHESDDNLEAEVDVMKLYVERDVAVQNTVENPENNKVIWFILEFLAQDEQTFLKTTVIFRSILSSVIVKWESFREQPTKNQPKLIEVTLRLLNVLNKVPGLIPKPLCFIVDIVPLINAYEAHVCLMLIWKNLKARLQPKQSGQICNDNLLSVDSRSLKYIFQKNIFKLDFLYARFFK